jgi:tetratricopeptide (TPR) repeat protein
MKVAVLVLLVTILIVNFSAVRGADSFSSGFDPHKPLTNKPFTDKARKLTSEALTSIVLRDDYESAIYYYKEALKEMPNDRGILIALSYTEYLRDKQRGLLDRTPNPKVTILLDALQYGKGDWQVSIRYLEEALSKEMDKDRLMAIRDALNTVRGIYEDIKFEEEMENMFAEDILRPLAMRKLREGFRQLEKGNYEAAGRSFRSAKEIYPADLRIRDILIYVEGLQFERYHHMKEWRSQQRARYDRLKSDGYRHKAEAERVLQQSQKALSLSQELQDEEATTISQKAIDLARQSLTNARAIIRWAETRLSALKKSDEPFSRGKVGIATTVGGKVYKKTAKGLRVFDGSSILSAGDELSTGADGFVDLTFADGSTVQIGHNSALILHRVRGRNSIYELLKGRLHAEMECYKTGGESCRRIKTGPGITVSVRGTEFDIHVGSDNQTTVMVFEGHLEVADKKDESTVEVKKGEKLVITSEGKVKGPTPVKLDAVKPWWEE